MADDHSVPDAPDATEAIPAEQPEGTPSAPDELENVAASLEDPGPAEATAAADLGEDASTESLSEPVAVSPPESVEVDEPASAAAPDEADDAARAESPPESEEPSPDEAGSESVSEPETPAAEVVAGETTVAQAEIARPSVSWWPFILYAIGWVALIASTVVLLTGEQAELPAFRQEYYPYIVLGGLVMTALGPVVSLAAWLWARARTEKGNRGGLFTSALLRGASLTLVGVLAWWSALVVVDAMRLDII